MIKISFFEKILKLKGFDIDSSFEQLKHLQSFTKDEFIEWQEMKKWEIAKFHFDNNAFYRNKVGKFFPNEWSELPIIEKNDLQGDLKSKISEVYNLNKLYVSNTSGSSGHPFYFVKNKDAHAMHWALIKHRYDKLKISFKSKQARFYGIPIEFSGNIKEKTKDLIMNRVRMPIFDLSDNNLQRFVELFSKNNFDYIYGYTNSIVIFAKYLEKNDIKLKDICPSLKNCIITSEILYPSDRDLLQNTLAVKVINEYGASEVGLIAIENFNSILELCEETVYVEIFESKIINEYSNPGKILVTSLHNKAMPFIRYNIGDLGSINNRQLGSTFKRSIKQLYGRENDTIILPSGKIAPGLTFYYVSRSIIEGAGYIKEFIIRQTKLDTFHFDIVSNHDLKDSHIKDIKDKLDNYLEPGLKVIINNIKKIKRPKSGKIKHFYSEIID